jgi:hypothetical protein
VALRPVGLLLLSVGLVVVPAEGLQAQPVTGNAADSGASGHRGEWATRALQPAIDAVTASVQALTLTHVKSRDRGDGRLQQGG